MVIVRCDNKNCKKENIAYIKRKWLFWKVWVTVDSWYQRKDIDENENKIILVACSNECRDAIDREFDYKNKILKR